MTTKSRRRVLKGLSAALPAVWARPVVEAVVLPAHAQTSTPVTTVNCGAPEDCYTFGGDNSFSWPGGAGPVEVGVFEDLVCSDPTDTMVIMVVAENAAAAQDLLLCDGVEEVVELVTEPSLSGCSFWFCGVAVLEP